MLEKVDRLGTFLVCTDGPNIFPIQIVRYEHRQGLKLNDHVSGFNIINAA